MKALTLWQPWAWLIVAGHKDIENRPWQPGRRLQVGERFLIHAGQKIDWDFGKERSNAWPDFDFPPVEFPAHYITGALIGSVQFDGVVEESDSPWFFGPYGWRISNPRQFETPIPCRGMQMLWTVPYETLQEVGA